MGGAREGSQALLQFSQPNQLFELLRCFWPAYSATTAHCAVSSETLDLQVRSAHPPMPHRTSSPSCPIIPARLIRQAEMFGSSGSPRLAPPNPLARRPLQSIAPAKTGAAHPGGVSGWPQPPPTQEGGREVKLSPICIGCGRSNQLHPPKPGRPTPGGVRGKGE